MVGDTFPYTYQQLILPNGSAIRFNRTSSGSDFSDAVYSSTASQSPRYGAILSYNYSVIPGAIWILKTRDGTTYGFPDGILRADQLHQALVGIQDRYGNTVSLVRDNATAELTSITSPNGRCINLQYDAQGRISQATDNGGRSVSYTYDGGGRLATVTDANGGVTTFAYNSNDQVGTVTDARGITYLTNQYDSYGTVTQQTLADAGSYVFNWTPSTNSTQT
jgi:YD repeat-containing protein